MPGYFSPNLFRSLIKTKNKLHKINLEIIFPELISLKPLVSQSQDQIRLVKIL